MLSNYSYVKHCGRINRRAIWNFSHRIYSVLRLARTSKSEYNFFRFRNLCQNYATQGPLAKLIFSNKSSRKLFNKSDIRVVNSVLKRFASNKNDKNPRNIWLNVFLAFLLLYMGVRLLGISLTKVIDWNTFVQDMLSKGEVEKIILHEDSNIIEVRLKQDAIIRGNKFPNGAVFILSLTDLKKFEEDLKEVEDSLGIPPGDGVLIVHEYRGRIISPLITLGILAILALMLSRIKVDVFSNMMGRFTKAKFTLIDPLAGHSKGVKFSDVAGLQEAKIEIMEFIDYLKRPDFYKNLGAKVPRGALLLGPPGCGKTLLAKAVASEANVPFLSMNGSEFIEVIGGAGAARVRDLFSEARKISPCIIYIDEIDAIGKKRTESAALENNSEADHTLNQLLVEMDGMASTEGVVTLASTNRAEVLDGALLRPGRFDRHIMIDLPTIEERREIFIHHLKNIHLEYNPEYYAKRLASLTPGFSGADIANICNEAALHAARFKKTVVAGDDLEYAVERVIGGAEKRSSVVSPEEKHLVAYHEAGRALISWLSEHGEIILKISVVPRTNLSVGWTQFSPPEQYLFSKEELFDKMCMALGGRAAEALVFNTVSTKSEKDLQKVTRIAYAQVRQYGMNNIIGPISFDDVADFYLKPYSKQLGGIIDEESRKLVSKAFFTAENILRENKPLLIKLAEELRKRETLNYNDVVELIGPPKYQNKKYIEPLAFEMAIDIAAGPEPPPKENEKHV